MTELRLHLAPENDEPKKMPADIAAALDEWRSINKDAYCWATFEAIQFNEKVRVVRVTYGSILSGGFKECEIGTIHYSLHPKTGELIVSRSTHA